MTQHISPVQMSVWTLCIWNTRKFKDFYEEHGYAVFVGTYGLYPVDLVRSIKVSTKYDFRLAELYLKSKRVSDEYKAEYYE